MEIYFFMDYILASDKISVLIVYALMSLINAHAVLSSEARVLNFGLSLHLHQYFVHASSEGLC